MNSLPSLQEKDIQRLVAYCRSNLGLTQLVEAQEYGYSSLPLCVIDCVFSIGVKYEAVRNTIQRFCDYYKIKRFTHDETDNAKELSITDLVQLYRDNSVEFMAREVYRNWQRTSTRGGILKAEAVLKVAETLQQFRVNYLSDLTSVAGNPQFEAAFQQIPGQKSGISLRYFYMLTGSVDHIKPDRMIMRFIESAIHRRAGIDESHQLLLETCRQLITDYPELNPRNLDHQIWLFQRKKATSSVERAKPNLVTDSVEDVETEYEKELSMHWEELTGDEFPQAVAKAESVCLLPLSVVERHAHHLPLGTDVYIARDLCRRTAALEPAIIFPDFIFTQIFEARHHPGTVAIDPTLIMALLESVCREIARNGLKKIVIVNGHGGNNALIPFFLQTQLASPRDYTVYLASPHTDAPIDGHAGATETSAIMVIRPDLVHPDKIYTDGEWEAQGRLKLLSDSGASTGIWWYADHPTHFSADANPSTAEDGERYLSVTAQALAKAIRAVKDDSTAKRLQDEFFAASQHG